MKIYRDSKDNLFNIDLFKKDERTFAKDRKLKDQFFIGRFNSTESGFLISDIRRSDFSKIKYKPSNAKAFTISVIGKLNQKIEDDAYYRFSWVMIESTPDYVFNVDVNKPIVRIYPKDIVNLLYEDIYDYPASASEKIVNTLDTLKNQLTASGKEVFIYELLQNANDYPQRENGKKKPVDIEFYITDNYLIFQHSGDYFDPKNIAAICSINDKEKTDNVEAIGYKGIGFKTVFLDNNYVLLRTGAYQFRFDYEKTKNIEDTPWQILPIWTENEKVDEEVLDVIDNADEKYRVQIALRPTESNILHYGEQNYENLFADVFETERVILFIPFINSVSVYTDDSKEPTIVRIKENDKWCVSEEKKYVGDIPIELTKELNRRIDKNDGKIPEKYYDFHKTSIGFACRREGNRLLPVDNACLYCYLPAKKAKFGFSFLMNTDMIPTGPRDNVEPKEKINHTIAKIAGKQFFNWIHDLLESNLYDYDSIFSLIPDFEACKEKYEDDKDVVKFIEEFQEGFENCLDEGEIIPVEIDGKAVLKSLNEVNYDEIGITCAGIISDEKLLKITEWSDYFPHPSLRDPKNQCLKPGIKAFLSTYVYDNYTLDINLILNSCEGNEFQEWLINQENNNAFLEFLLNKNYISQFNKKTVFITEDNELNASINIYENIDDVYPSLTAFNDYLPRLSKETRKYFEENETWDNVKSDLFRSFNPDNFVDKELYHTKNIKDTIERLKDKNTSLGFFDFLAKHVGYGSFYKTFPIFDFRDNVIDNFHCTIYFYHEDGEELYDASWTDCNWINLISKDYSKETIDYLKNNFGVTDFSIKKFVDKVLLTDNARNYLNDLGQEHIDFVHYCFEHKECFEKEALNDYALWTYNKDEDNVLILSEDTIFFQNALMDSYQEKVWVKNGWMYQLYEKYFDNIKDDNAFRRFLSDTFGVYTFTQESFFNHVVSKHVTDICKNVGGTSSNTDTDESIDILTYLGENYKLIFDEVGNEKFIHLPIYRYDVWDKVTDRDTEVYLYDKELKELIEAEWTPEDFVYMLEERYNEIFSKYPALRKKLNINLYSFKNIKDILLKDINSIIESTEEKEQNISFHRFMVEHKDELTRTDYKQINKLEFYAVDSTEKECTHIIDEKLYISNAYMESGRGMESMVKKYDDTAFFTSDSYLKDKTNEEEIQLWKSYFIELGVNSDIKDIIFKSVLPNLADIKDKDIVSLLAGYYDYFHAEDEWEDCLQKLKHLNVVIKNGEDDFCPLKDVLFNDCYDAEPFPYLVIKNEIAGFYHNSPDAMRLLREIVDNSKTKDANVYRSFKTKEEWKKEKLEWYLYLQNENTDNIENIHPRFILDLARDYAANYDLYTKAKVKEILLLGKDNLFHYAKDLTEGTAYQPRCSFEKYGIPLIYVSETYLPFENPDAKEFRKLFTDMEVVYDFHSQHLKYLQDNYKFTVYFWTDYLSQFSNRTHITATGNKGSIAQELSNYATIPTGNLDKKEVRKPSQLYTQSLIQNGYVKKMVRDYEDKMPLEKIFSTDAVRDILNNLNFATTLSFEDCLECLLHTKDKSKRKDILFWLSTKHTIDHVLVNSYLCHENSKWKNGRGEFMFLKDLNVLHIEDNRLRQLFGRNAKVLSQEYIESTLVFEAFCRIFNIKPLTESDFNFVPDIYEEPTTEEMQQKLRLPLLIAAAVSKPNNWKELYEDYCKKLDNIKFYRCKSISFSYQDLLSDSSIQYYKKDEELFFVEDWMGRRVFNVIISDLVNYFDIDIDSNLIADIFEADESNQKGIIDNSVSYELTKDDEFIGVLKVLNASIAEGVHIIIEDEEEKDNSAASFGTNTHEESYDDNSEYIEEEVDYQDKDYNKDNDDIYVNDEDDNEEETDFEDNEVEVNDEDEDDNEEDNTSAHNNRSTNFHSKFSTEECHTSKNWNNSSSEKRESQRSEDTISSKERPHHSEREYQTSKKRDTESSSYTGREHEGKRPHRESTNRKRRNYMGYNPDETNQRPFNVGRQEPTCLETKEATEDEISRLSALLGRAFDRDSITDENYLVRMRFYNSVKESVGTPKMSEKEFLEKGSKYIQTNNGKYVHRCSARGGILYISPSIWNRVQYDSCVICMYYGKKANQFLYIRSQKELMEMIDKDAVVVQVTGNDKGTFINRLYNTKFPNMNGNIYTMIRTIKTNSDDFIFNENDISSKTDMDFDPDLI